ncbi:MAG: DUF1192 domain-containing protein [Alphaproteobacteria bacterium]|jgi:uncharacterized small protein (DUF1192 family)|nr:DUF1192 domain-containing protein [Alphaproteobacteria bacterium]MBP9868025.1 DUF1192 domain-containing protein [Alphaproteobacteria bacterium]
MFDDENEPRLAKKVLKKLDGMSIDELNAYVQEMKDEIARAEAEIKKKEAHRDAASVLFKSKSS